MIDNLTLHTIQTAIDKGDQRRAHQLINKLPPKMLDYPDVILLRAKYAYLIQDFNECIHLLKPLIETDNPNALDLIASAYFSRYQHAPIGHARRSDADNALKYYHLLINKFPKYDDIAWTYYHIGTILNTLNQKDSACACFRNSLNLPAKNTLIKSYAYERLADYEFYVRRDFKQAFHLLELALAIHDNSEDTRWIIDAYLFRARIQQVLKQPDEIYQSIEIAIHHARSYFRDDTNELAEILFISAELLAQVESHEEQSAHYMEEYLRLRPKPDGIDVSWSRGNEIIANVRFAEGNYDEALVAYKATLQYNPYHPWNLNIHYQIALCYYQQGLYQKCIDTIEHLLNIAHRDNIIMSDYRVYDVLGSAQFALGNFKEASESYQEALSLTPPQPNVIDKIKLYWHYSLQLAQKKD
jgi:tetratricopeptide (TPR) repeat protein